MRYIITFILLVAAVGCGNQQRSELAKPRPVKCCIAEPAGYLDREFVGLSTPDEAVNLAFKLSGQILQLPVTKGDMVDRGELLAELDPRDMELQVSADLSAYEQALSRMERVKRLLAREAVSRQEYEIAQAEYARAKSTYANSQELLVQTELRAPFAAVVERVDVDLYQRVMAGEVVLRVVSPQSTTVEFTLPESSLSILADSSTYFTVEFDDYPGVKFNAHLKEYARTSSDASGLPAAVTILNQATDRYTILAGMSAVVNMYNLSGDKKLVRLPLSAIYAPAGGGEYVWVIDSMERVELRAVEMDGIVGRSSVIVGKGLTAGERVACAGLYQIEEGEHVKILQ